MPVLTSTPITTQILLAGQKKYMKGTLTLVHVVKSAKKTFDPGIAFRKYTMEEIPALKNLHMGL